MLGTEVSFVCPDCGGSDERVIDSEWRLHICPMPASRLNRRNVSGALTLMVCLAAVVIYVMYLTFPWFLA